MSMKRVTLLGDSIRMGYQDSVRLELSEFAEVWAPEGNGMHSVHHLFNLAWYLEQPADVIHFNFGLWDSRRLDRGEEVNAVPVELFIRNLDFILGKVRASTDATLIWATITPILPERYNNRLTKPYNPHREFADSSWYNAAALPILTKHGVRINDLYNYVLENGTEHLICSDGVHFTEEGYKLLGMRVASIIRRVL